MQKRLLSFVVLAMLAFAACQKEDANLTQTATQTTSLQSAQTTTTLTAADEVELRGGGGCDSPSVKAIAFTDLPAAAQTWLLANADTSKIKKYASITCPDGTVTYAAGSKNGVVRFDSTGTVVSGPQPGGPSTGGNGPCAGAKFEVATVAVLPAAAQTYLTDHQLDATKVKVVKITCPDGTVTYVVAGPGGSVKFDATGTVIGGGLGNPNPNPGGNGPCKDAKVEAIALTDLPAAAQAWLTTNNVETANSKIVKFTCPDGTVTYGVIGKDGRILFASTGAVIGNPHIGGPSTGNNPCAGTAPEKITVTDLPQAAQDWISQNAANQEVQSVVKYTKPDCTIYYEVKFKHGKVVRFDKDGVKIQ